VATASRPSANRIRNRVLRRSADEARQSLGPARTRPFGATCRAAMTTAPVVMSLEIQERIDAKGRSRTAPRPPLRLHSRLAAKAGPDLRGYASRALPDRYSPSRSGPCTSSLGSPRP
jgi:hypothetical protein